MCSIFLRIDLLLFAFRANMCTPKGKTPLFRRNSK
nr:MAG TPA: hypothetical protein [Caudoviricetes sp.]